jgi:soluble lytic murein transglycosylase
MDELAWTAANYPESSLAAEALWQRARLAEDWIGSRAARDIYVQLADAFAASGRAGQALSRAAVLALEADDLAEARSLWKQLGNDVPEASARAEGLFRLGKNLLQGGDAGGGTALLERAEAAAPSSFAGLRAREARQIGLGSEPYRSGRASTIGATNAADAESCTRWVASWAQGSGDAIPDARLARIDRLMAVGMPGAGDAEALEAIAASSPSQLHPLATAFSARRMYPLSMLAASRLAAASPAHTVDASPSCLQRLAYPLAFPELVGAQATAHGLDPYLLLSLMRQESWFSPNARSGAPALGLSQVIPATAADIAKNLGRTGFRFEDLARPTEAVTFGSWYLAQQIRDLGQRPVLALAAYNAGPGNARRWAGRNLSADPDDFVYSIDFAETRNYVRSIYEHYGHYRQLYG